jgi:hypothetical protein
MTEPTKEAWGAADALEHDDDKPWDEDFKRGIAMALDAFAAQRVAEAESSRKRHALGCLPDCMMPDGAEPCRGYLHLLEPRR